jgi:glycosyltransferase involved in cell wall biosynthesis
MARKCVYPSKSIVKQEFVLVKHSLGKQYVGPAEDLERYLLELKVKKLTVISHPLNAASDKFTEIRIFENGDLAQCSKRSRLLPRMIGQIFDSLFTPLPQDGSIVFCFNAYAAFITKPLIRKPGFILGTWSVDYTPDSQGIDFTRSLYNAIQRHISKRIDFRIENSEAALIARNVAAVTSQDCRHLVVPIGIWTEDYVETSTIKKRSGKQLIFLGSLNERTGSDLLIETLLELTYRNLDFTAHVIGKGPAYDRLMQLVDDEHKANQIFIHGFLPEGPTLRELLFSSSIALAPFSNGKANFTQFADPQKIKRYLAAGLYVLSTEVPPIASVLEANGVGEIINSQHPAKVWADKIELILSSRTLSQVCERATDFALDFENTSLFAHAINFVINDSSA